MSERAHHQQGAESMGGGNSGRRTSTEPSVQSGAGLGKKKNAGRKKSASRPKRKAAA